MVIQAEADVKGQFIPDSLVLKYEIVLGLWHVVS